jgi:hypothetical protein
VRCDYDGFTIFDVRLETLQPVSAGAFQTIEIQDTFSSEQTIGSLIGFERSIEFPSFIAVSSR